MHSPSLSIIAKNSTEDGTSVPVLVLYRYDWWSNENSYYWATNINILMGEFPVHKKLVHRSLSDQVTWSTILVQTIKDTMLWLSLNIRLCWGQCYSGASIMSGTKSGVAKLFCNDEPRVVYTYCYGYVLNLAVNDIWAKTRHVRT